MIFSQDHLLIKMSFIHHILPLTQHGAKIQSTDMHFFMLQKLKLGRGIHVL